MNKKQKNAKEVEYLREVTAEAERINKKLEEDLRKIIKSGESLSNYELWVSNKCNVAIRTSYIIDIVIKDLTKEKTLKAPYKGNNDLVYVIVRKERKRNESNE